jgi:hypothetical protein
MAVPELCSLEQKRRWRGNATSAKSDDSEELGARAEEGESLPFIVVGGVLGRRHPVALRH